MSCKVSGGRNQEEDYKSELDIEIAMTQIIGIKMPQGIAIIGDTLISKEQNQLDNHHEIKVYKETVGKIQYILGYTKCKQTFHIFADNFKNQLIKQTETLTTVDIINLAEVLFKKVNSECPKHFDLLIGIMSESLELYQLDYLEFNNIPFVLRDKISKPLRVLGEGKESTYFIFNNKLWVDLGEATKVAVLSILYSQNIIPAYVGIEKGKLPNVEWILTEKNKELDKEKLEEKDKKIILEECEKALEEIKKIIQNISL